ncbi:MAG: GNAT family N-acetyltransferase [Clostridia bacterium]|nr:GNAT family N-acetyltransferase [Clostridia bacterium]
MLFEEKHIVLKDRTPALLRPARVEDAAALVDYLIATAGETEFILAYPDERAGMTVEQEERFLQGVADAPDHVFIVCEVNGEIAGNCSLQYNPKRKVRHRGAVAITLYKKFWNRGIGTAMFGLMFDIARGWGLEQLELEYVEGNERGRALYEKTGFETYAVLPNAYHLSDGSSRGSVMMVKKL